MAGRLVLLVLLVPYVLWLVCSYEYHFLDGVNLAFHEAGHLFLAFFGTTLQFLGGTLGQLFFPVACAVHFLRRDQPFEACLMGIWACESGMYAARYIADAQEQILPLVGGHIHDWHWLLSRWGVLGSCEAIGAAVHGIASVGAVACLTLGASMLAREHRACRSEERPLAVTPQA